MKIEKINNMYSVYTDNRLKPVNQTQPQFTGLKNIFKKAEPIYLNTDLTILSPQQIQKAKKYVVQEVYSLIANENYSKIASERLDKLLNSPYIDYSINKAGKCDLALVDLINTKRNIVENNKLYNQFLRTSLAKSMPMELLDTESKELLYKRNNGIFQILRSYTKMNETSKEAGEVRDMIMRFKEHNIKIDNYPEFFADCMISNKLEMCKFLNKELNINPETRFRIIKDDRYYKKYFNSFGVSSSLYDPGVQTPSCYIRPGKFLVIYPEKCVNNTILRNQEYETMSLYDLEAILPHNNKVFDIPQYICDNYGNLLQRETLLYKHAFKDVDLTERFLWQNHGRHPELDSIDFLEKFAKCCMEKSENWESYLDSVNITKKHLKDLELLRCKLKFYSPSTEERLNRIEKLCDYAAARLENK